ncbi:unnamed protein product [Linum trigynum]|uniref:Uncharacterized protein n=1 Tax=Linum trigynum TaxID=586398 RepID=A0AAV2DET7_9ROSI
MLTSMRPGSKDGRRQEARRAGRRGDGGAAWRGRGSRNVAEPRRRTGKGWRLRRASATVGRDESRGWLGKRACRRHRSTVVAANRRRGRREEESWRTWAAQRVSKKRGRGQRVLFDNQLGGRVPDTIGKLKSLEVIRVGGNKNLEGSIPL